MCLVPGSEFQQPDRVYEGRVLKSRHAKPRTTYVCIPDKDNNIYMFDSKLVRAWVQDYRKSQSTGKRTRRSSTAPPTDDEATVLAASAQDDASKADMLPVVDRAPHTVRRWHCAQAQPLHKH